MLDFLSRRLAAALVTLALATVVVFAVVEVLPGDPALVMLGTDARPDTLAALRAQVRLRPAAADALPALDRRAADLRSRQQPRLRHLGRQADRRSPRRHPAARRAGACRWAMLVAIPLGVFAAWKHGTAGRLGRHGLHPDRHLGAELLVRHRAGAGLRRDLADVSRRRLPGLAGAAEVGARADPAGAVAVARRDRDPDARHALGHARHPARGLCPHRPRQGRAASASCCSATRCATP